MTLCLSGGGPNDASSSQWISVLLQYVLNRGTAKGSSMRPVGSHDASTRTIASVAITYVGGPTAIVEVGGVRLITDPTFDPPGDHPVGSRVLTKIAGPALAAEEVGRVDAVLLSHDQHPDNLDDVGREFLAAAPLVLSTPAARSRLGGSVRVLSNWDQVDLSLPDGGRMRVRGVPAEHGPDGSLPVVGEVTGFVVSGDGLPTLYVSGDNASLEVVREIAGRAGPIDIALLFAGGADDAP